MTGKVFLDSADVYQDQAQVLFDYYRQAAEKIVSQELELEQKIDTLNNDYQSAQANAEAAHSKGIKMLIVCGVAAVVVLVLGLMGYVHPGLVAVPLAVAAYLWFTQHKAEKNAKTAGDECLQRIGDLQAQWQGIRRNYKVSKIGVAYVPVAQRVQAGDKSFVVDYTGEQPKTNFALTLINQPGELKEVISDLQEHLSSMPAVESNDEVEEVDTSDYSTSVQDITLHDYVGTIDRQIRNARYLIGDSRDVSVSIPVIPPASARYRVLNEFATDNTSGYPVIPVFDLSSTQQMIDDFSALGEINRQSEEDGSGDVNLFTDVMQQLAQGVDLLSRSKTESVTKLTNYSNDILKNVLKASYDQYSPALEAEEIERIRTATFNYSDEVGEYRPFSLKESSRVRYDIFADAWMADNGTRTAIPFGMHQVDEEVLMPVISNLMQENRKERLRIYNDIQNQKTDYLNQWHRDTDDFFGRNRTEANALLQRMNEAYAEYVESYTNYKQQSATFNAMKESGNLANAEVEEASNQAEVIAGFQSMANQARAKQEQFSAFMDRIREDIDECAKEFGHVEYYEASLRDSLARDNAQAAADIHELSPRRKGLVSVNPYLASYGSIPPEPSVSEKLNDDFTIDLSRTVEQQVGSLFEGDSNSDLDDYGQEVSD